MKNNSNRINNISDLIVYLKFFDKKLSSQFLCQLLDENSEDYYTLCSIGYYIIGYESRYKVVLNYLFKTIMNFVRNYQTHTKSLLEDAKYFYILNDFIYYPGFQGLKKEGQFIRDILEDLKDEELNKLERDRTNYLIFKELMKQSYFNWDLQEHDFKKLQIKKKATDSKSYSFNDY